MAGVLAPLALIAAGIAAPRSRPTAGHEALPRSEVIEESWTGSDVLAGIRRPRHDAQACGKLLPIVDQGIGAIIADIEQRPGARSRRGARPQDRRSAGMITMPRRPTLFLRIHKTAGEALAKQIRDRLPPDTVCPEQFEWRARALPPATLRQFSFFHGHMTPPTLSAAFPSLQVFTMMREPRARLLSCFFYWKAGARTVRNEFFDAIAKLSLLEFLRSDEPVIRRVTWNVQARLLAGGQFGGVDHLRQNVFGPWVRECDLAAEAVRAMDRFAFIGITERYQASLQAAYTLLELGQAPPPERINATSRKPVGYDALLATPDIDRALRRLTEADQVVYDEACRRFDIRAGAAVAGQA